MNHHQDRTGNMRVKIFVFTVLLIELMNGQHFSDLCDVNNGCELKSEYDICNETPNCMTPGNLSYGFQQVYGSEVNIKPYKAQFMVLTGKFGEKCDSLYSPFFNTSQAKSYKVEVLHYGTMSNLSVLIKGKKHDQYQQIAFIANISLALQELKEGFKPVFSPFQLVIQACVYEEDSIIAIFKTKLLTQPGTQNSHSCTRDQFSCGNSSCIPSSDVCNFVADCANHLDESKEVCGEFSSISYCNFDTLDWCGWHNIENGENAPDILKWKWMKGATYTENTGPDEDHTSGNGHYVYMDASDGKFTQAAILESPVFNIASSSGCMVRFHYHMFGMYVSFLKLKLIPLQRNSDLPCKETHHLELWSQYKNKGNDWKYAEVEIKNISSRFRLHFIAHVGFKSQGDIAIDDVSFSSNCFNDDSAYLKSFNRTSKKHITSLMIRICL